MKLNYILFLLFLLPLTACGTSFPTQDNEEMRPAASELEKQDEILTSPLAEVSPTSTAFQEMQNDTLTESPSATPTKSEKFRTLTITLKLRDNNGARWMHNKVPLEKGLYVDFQGTCEGCQILYPRKYRDGNDAEVYADGKFYFPPEGQFRFLVPDDITTLTVSLIDMAGNSIYIKDDLGINSDDDRENDHDEATSTTQVTINEEDGATGEANFFVIRDEEFRAILFKTTHEECVKALNQDNQAKCIVYIPKTERVTDLTADRDIHYVMKDGTIFRFVFRDTRQQCEQAVQEDNELTCYIRSEQTEGSSDPSSTPLPTVPAARIEELRLLIKKRGFNITDEEEIKRIAVGDINEEWRILLNDILGYKNNETSPYFSIVELKLMMGEDGTKIYREITELFRNQKLDSNQQQSFFILLNKIATAQSAHTLLDVIAIIRANFDPSNTEINAMVERSIKSIGIIVGSPLLSREDASQISMKLEPMLLPQEGFEGMMFPQVADAIGTIGASSGVETLLSQLTANPDFQNRQEIFKKRITFLTERYLRDMVLFLFGPPENQIALTSENILNILENALSRVRSVEGTEVLVRCLNDGKPADYRTIACGRALARMFYPVEPLNQNSAAQASILEWFSKADDTAAPLVQELLSIILSDDDFNLLLQGIKEAPITLLNNPDEIWSRLKDQSFHSPNIRNTIELMMQDAIKSFNQRQVSIMNDPELQECRGNQTPVDYKRLSNEKTFPFLFYGRPLQNDRRDYESYLDSIARFPDVQSCLKDAETKKAMPDLVQFDWNKLRNNGDAEVCLYRVFSSIGTVKGSEDWLKSQGFRGTGISPIDAILMGYHGEQAFVGSDEDEAWYREIGEPLPMENPDPKPGTQLNGSWSIEQCGARFKDFAAIGSYSLSIAVTFSEGEVTDTVDVGYNYL